MIKKAVNVINDFSGGQDTKTPIISMELTKSPNMRNYHCAGVKNRLKKRGGMEQLNTSAVETDNLDVFYPPGYQTTDYALRDTAARTQISQGFKCATSSTVIKVRLWLKKVGTPAGTDTITLEIQPSSGGVPTGAEVTNGVSTAIDISDTSTLVTTGYSWVTFTFATAPSLTAGTQYHLVLTGAFTVSDTNYILWGVDNYDVIYPDGTMSVYDASTWVADTLYNAIFEVYISGGAKGNDGVAVWDFSSKNMLIGVFGTSLYKMDKNSSGNPDGVWDTMGGGTSWSTYTKLMMHCDGVDEATTFTDEIGKTVTAVGSAQLDTGTKKFGSASLQIVRGTSDNATLADNDDWNFGDGDFTIELQVYIDNTVFGQNNGFIEQYTANYYWGIRQKSTGELEFAVNNNGVTLSVLGTPTWVADTWYHIMVCRYGNVFTAYCNGSVVATVTQAYTMPDVAAVVAIGGGGLTQRMTGRIDEVRILKGKAAQIAAFTAPAAAYSASATPLTSSRFWTMVDWQSGRALINSDIGLYTYLGTGNISAVSAAPVGKFVTIWKKYVFLAGIRGSPNTVRYSDLSDYATWTAANTLNFDTSDGDVITGIRTLKGKLYTFKRYSIHRITYLGSNPTFQVDQVSGIGCPSHYTIKEVDMGGDLGTVLIFLTSDKKFAIFDGYNVQIINDVLTEETNDLFASADDQPLSLSDLNLRFVDLYHSVVRNDTQEYIMYCVLGTDTTVNYAFVFDYRTGGIYPYDGQSFASSCYALSTNKVKKLYCSGYTGYTWLQESGDDDDGTAINAYWVSGKIKSQGIALINKNLVLGINVKEIPSSSTLNLNVQFRLDWNVSWSTAQTFTFSHNDKLAFGKTGMLDVGSISDMFQIKIKDNSSSPGSIIYGFELYGRPTPMGVGIGDRATV